jgi:hypothetical protein
MTTLRDALPGHGSFRAEVAGERLSAYRYDIVKIGDKIGKEFRYLKREAECTCRQFGRDSKACKVVINAADFASRILQGGRSPDRPPNHPSAMKRLNPQHQSCLA